MQRVRFTLVPSNYVFRIAPDVWEKIKAVAITEFSARTLSYMGKYVIDRLEVQDDSGKLTLTYFTSYKLVIQGRPNSAKMNSLAKRIEESFSLAEEKTKEAPYVELPKETEITKEIQIGLDEAGPGETFGSLFLGCGVVQAKSLPHLRGLLGKKKFRELGDDAILNHSQSFFSLSDRRFRHDFEGV